MAMIHKSKLHSVHKGECTFILQLSKSLFITTSVAYEEECNRREAKLRLFVPRYFNNNIQCILASLHIHVMYQEEYLNIYNYWLKFYSRVQMY